MRTLWQDLKFSVRLLRKSPGFTALAVLALGLGIGANTAIFSVADAFLIRPYPFHNLDRLAVVLELHPHQTEGQNSVAPANFTDWKSEARSFDRMSAYRWDEMNMSQSGPAEKVAGFDVSPDFFGTVGVRPVLGRDFHDDDSVQGHNQVVLLSDGLWRRKFGADPNIVGQTIRLDEKPYTVIGVMGRDAVLPQTAELWMPLSLDPKDWASRSAHSLFIVARLRAGVALDQAQAEMYTIAHRLSDAYPDTNRDWSARVMSLALFTVGEDTRQYTYLLLGAVGFVLLIACANVANLQLARATSRHKEIAVRVALGANRWRIVRQLLAESTLLGLGGGVVGVLLATWSVHLILIHMPADVAKYIGGWDQIKMDPAALGFAIAIAIFAGVLAGLAPALQSSRVDLNETLKESGRGTSSGRGRHRMRNVLAVAQVSLALVLLVGAGLMVKGFGALLNINHGYDPESVLTMRTNLPGLPAYKDRHVRAQFYEKALAQLSVIPGVQSLALATSVPYGDYGNQSRFSIEGRPASDASQQHSSWQQQITPNFFATMHVPLIQGRYFDDRDEVDGAGVAIINQKFAKTYWPNESAIGHRVKLGADNSDNPWLTIVGIVADVQYDWSDRVPEMVLYRPDRQAPPTETYIVIRAPGDVLKLSSAVRGAMAGLDADQPVFEIKTLDTIIRESVIGLAYVAVILGVAGLLALVLAAVGVYGVMAYLVSERVHEIGIRMALGAAPGDVLRMVMRRGLLLAAIGILIGLPCAYGLANVLTGLIYGIRATDISTFAGISLLLAAIAALACYIPARRATRVDPLVALRYE